MSPVNAIVMETAMYLAASGRHTRESSLDVQIVRHNINSDNIEDLNPDYDTRSDVKDSGWDLGFNDVCAAQVSYLHTQGKKHTKKQGEEGEGEEKDRLNI
jgi:hypothetical protein